MSPHPGLRARRGTSAMEAGLALPILALLALPPIDFAWFFVLDQSVVQAAQNGTRAGSKAALADAAVAAKAEAELSLATMLGSALATTATVSTSVVLTDAVEVSVSLPYTPIVGFLSMPSHVTAVHRMRVEEP